MIQNGRALHAAIGRLTASLEDDHATPDAALGRLRGAAEAALECEGGWRASSDAAATSQQGGANA
jgi:hypothetical protein